MCCINYVLFNVLYKKVGSMPRESKETGKPNKCCQIVPILANPKSQFGYIMEGLQMENVGIFYVYLDYSTYGHFVQFVPFCNFVVIGYVFLPPFGRRKNLATLHPTLFFYTVLPIIRVVCT
jgi:hypothetical protein